MMWSVDEFWANRFPTAQGMHTAQGLFVTNAQNRFA